MENNELYFLRRQLEQNYALESDIQATASISACQRLQAAWQNLATFMIHHPKFQLQPPETASKAIYTRKARLYPYLPPVEEERDWLEKIYGISK